jgi:hypothetical protein
MRENEEQKDACVDELQVLDDVDLGAFKYESSRTKRGVAWRGCMVTVM